MSKFRFIGTILNALNKVRKYLCYSIFSDFLGIKSEINRFDEKTVFLEEIFKDSITKFHGNKIKKFCF